MSKGSSFKAFSYRPAIARRALFSCRYWPVNILFESLFSLAAILDARLFDPFLKGISFF